MAKPTLPLPLEPTFQNIPADLVALNRWVVWVYEPSKGGKPKKAPKCASSLRGYATSTDPNTWTSFGLAQTAY